MARKKKQDGDGKGQVPGEDRRNDDVRGMENVDKQAVELKVARMAAWQAITVAVITGVAGIATGWFARPTPTLPELSNGHTQRWITIGRCAKNPYRESPNY